MAHELHISSLVIHARPEALPSVCARIEALEGMEVHVTSPLGKIVATLETETEQTIVTHLNTISLLDGVMAATLVFHHVEPLQEAV